MKNQLDVRKEIAGRLQAAREKAGYEAAADFCSKYEFPLEEYVRYENAKTPIIASHAVKYCEALKISLYHLMIGAELEELKKWRDKRRAAAERTAAKAKKAKDKDMGTDTAK